MAIVFFVALIGLLEAYIAAKDFQKIAEDKGYSDSGSYFWWTFLVPPVGMAMVIALPDLTLRNKIGTGSSTNVSQHETHRADDVCDELPEL